MVVRVLIYDESLRILKHLGPPKKTVLWSGGEGKGWQMMGGDAKIGTMPSQL